jgi:uncharacterized protein (DUF2252 family)
VKVAGGRREELRSAGRKLRAVVPRSSHAAWRQPDSRPDPVAMITESNRSRLPDLVPVRNYRMMESPFTFYRGAPLVMASDLSSTPTTGVNLQICGDAHLLNFGMFATPERNLVFDVNDFDETQPGPWEWDVKRLAASLVVAARTAGLRDDDGIDAVHQCVARYRSALATMAELSAFEVWYERVDVDSLEALASTKQAKAAVRSTAAKARRHTSLQALDKLTTIRDGRREIVEDPPLIVRLGDAELDFARGVAASYLATIEPDRRHLLDKYEFVDAARKVVGVGSVGTRCYMALLAGTADLDPLFLQIKEAQESVLARYAGRPRSPRHGYRVVVGQRIMQAASDIFLGWARVDGFDGYVRQLRDMKGAPATDGVTADSLSMYGGLCGETLGRAHARSGEPALLAGYLGNGGALDDALAQFATAYADQTERDYDAFVKAARTGRIAASPG